ncbi:helix-turn-helix domain-containing protein [Halomicroarcula sp. F13]|uniref:Helix-turn-helix domain-containing protein n=1 Tax=Haloarcula rubra TaxID=2487747 RepID=A0AAW4PUL0_9EURY|nr:helix-turn-helix domain-containing protein [Halomicroarcula rubra]MBX0324324.1 helix-turn-helix domain-containing protein [Halomicroarcula rubra]
MEDRAANFPENGTASGELGETAVVGPSSDPRRSGERADVDADSDAPSRTICGDFTLTHSDIALTDVTAEVPDVTVRPERVVPDGSDTMFLFAVHADEFDRFEQTLGMSSAVSDYMLISNGRDGRCYRATLGEGTMTISPMLTRLGARTIDVVGSAGKWDVRAQFRSRETFLQFRSHCADNDISFRLHRLCWDDGGSDWRLNGLSPEQWDALCQAYEAGYFDVPRDISQLELAERLGVSPSAVSQRLRRATSQLIEAQLETDDA